MISVDIMPNAKRTALLIRCSVEEAKEIRTAAKKQGRTISSYVLRALGTRLKIERTMEERASQFFENYMKKKMRPPL